MTLIEQALARIAEMEKRAEGANCGGSATDLILTDLPALCALVKALLRQYADAEDWCEAYNTPEQTAALKAFVEAK